MPEQTDAFTIPGPLLRSIVQYLAGRPYAEVAGVMHAINTQVRPAGEAEAIRTEKEEADG